MTAPVKVLIQYILPHHLLSRIVHFIMRSRSFPFRRGFVNYMVRKYDINTEEALESNLHDRGIYPDLNSCFTRALKPGIRPVSEDPLDICSPADGTLSQLGNIENEQIFQAKGHDYSLTELLGGDTELAARFRNGCFFTTYLSPRDYHRVHMPYTGTLREMIHVPGRLFSVAPHCIANIPRLFARNERVISLFDTEAGPMAVILVGAIFVGSIETVWAGEVSPPHGRRVKRTVYPDEKAISLARAEEMGRFNLGSTVIVLFAHNQVTMNDRLKSNEAIFMGQTIGRVRNGG